MTILVVVTTILSLLASSAVSKVDAQGPINFDYPSFDENSKSSLTILGNASINSLDHVIKLTDPTDSWCVDNLCRGQIIYSTAIDFIDGNLQRTMSFSSSFVFSLTVIPGHRTIVRKGEGFVFFLIADPYATQSNRLRKYFGALPSKGQTLTPTIAVEFDTKQSTEVHDIDDNHVGVDVNQAASRGQESCHSENISLASGLKIKTWIDYHDSIKTLEVRLAYWTPNVVRPENPLIDMSLDLTNLVDSRMYVGFSGQAARYVAQESAIYSWSFHSQLETPASTSTPSAPSSNRSRSKYENIILGLCLGGGLGVIVALAGCFLLGLYCSKKSTEFAKAQEDRRKQSEAARYARDVEKDDKNKKYDKEGYVISDDAEADTFGAGIFGPMLSRAKSFRSMTPTGGNDPTSTALRQGHNEEVMPRKVKKLEADDVQADAVRKGILDNEGNGTSAPSRYRRRGQSEAEESTDAPVSSIQVEKTTWGSGRTRELHVVVKKSEPLLDRNMTLTSPVRRVSSSMRSPLASPQHASPPEGTMMYVNTLYDSSPEESRETQPRRRSPYSDDDLHTDDNIYLHPTVENIYDRSPVSTDYGEEIVERTLDLEISEEEEDVGRTSDAPDVSDGQHSEISITSVDSHPVPTPAPKLGSRLPSRSARLETRKATPKLGGSRLSSRSVNPQTQQASPKPRGSTLPSRSVSPTTGQAAPKLGGSILPSRSASPRSSSVGTTTPDIRPTPRNSSTTIRKQRISARTS